MTKTCSVCKEHKSIDDFYKLSKSKDGVANLCKECDKKRYKTYYQKNTISISKRTRNYRKENKDSHNLSSKKYYINNKDKVNNAHKNYYKNNKHIFTQKSMYRYARKKQQTPLWLNAGHIAEMEGYYLFCQIFKGFQVDHIIPINGKIVSGMHVPWNLQVLTAEENRAKSNSFNPDIYSQNNISI